MNTQRNPTSLLDRLLGRSDITFDGSDYMHRWRLVHRKHFGLRIHRIVRSDNDRELHDHPFTFLSIILWGGYWEHRPVMHASAPKGLWCADCSIDKKPCPACCCGPTERRWHGPGSILLRRAEDLHRLELSTKYVYDHHYSPFPGRTIERPAWTMSLRGPLRREWGFMTLNGWMTEPEFAKMKGYK